MLTTIIPITPAHRLASDIESRAIETQLIMKLLDIGDLVLGGLSSDVTPVSHPAVRRVRR